MLTRWQGAELGVYCRNYLLTEKTVVITRGARVWELATPETGPAVDVDENAWGHARVRE
jgi:hypothetical protein